VLIKSQKDFFSGLLFTAIGVAFALGAVRYNIGSGGRMGPGYFPLLLGIILAVLGGIVMFRALVVESASGDKIGKWAFKPLVLVIAANVIFGIMIGGLPSLGLPPMGLIVGIFALVFVASLAGDQFHAKEVFILSVVLSVGSYLAFVVLLKLQFPVWPTFIAG